MAHILAQIRKAGIYILFLPLPTDAADVLQMYAAGLKSGLDLTVSGYACRLKEPSECRNDPLH